MKVMTYNILDKNFAQNKNSRINKIFDVIISENPDFLALQEADELYENNSTLLKELSVVSNLPYYVSVENSPCHVAVLSRYPIKDTYIFPTDLFTEDAISVFVETPFWDISICCIHLECKNISKKLEEAKIILDYQSQFKSCIILWDFNAISESDVAGYDLSNWEFTHYGLTEFNTMNLFNTTYNDAAICLNKNNMTTHPTLWIGHPISKTGIRIDYMFVSESLLDLLYNIQAIVTPTTEIASDHYPLVLQLKS